MKKTAYVALSLALAGTLSLSACGSASSGSGTTSAGGSSPIVTATSGSSSATAASTPGTTSGTGTGAGSASGSATLPDTAVPTTAGKSTPVSTGSLTEALPTSTDMEWHQAGDWIVDANPGNNREGVAECLSGLRKITTNEVPRAYTLKGSTGDDWATANVLQFRTAAEAKDAESMLKEIAVDCQTSGSNPWHPVKVTGGTAGFAEGTIRIAGSEEGDFFAIGFYRAGTRVGVITMTTRGQDNNWDYVPSGAVGAMHPMYRTLPKATARLAG